MPLNIGRPTATGPAIKRASCCAEYNDVNLLVKGGNFPGFEWIPSPATHDGAPMTGPQRWGRPFQQSADGDDRVECRKPIRQHPGCHAPETADVQQRKGPPQSGQPIGLDASQRRDDFILPERPEGCCAQNAPDPFSRPSEPKPRRPEHSAAIVQATPRGPCLSIIFRRLKAAILSRDGTLPKMAAAESAVSFHPLSYSARQPMERDCE
jgi:hypothetical protein